MLHIITYILYVYIFLETRKERNNKKDNWALERIADAFCKRNTEAPIILPPENDAIDAIVSVVETRLRKLPQNILDDTAQKLFQLTYELIKNISWKSFCDALSNMLSVCFLIKHSC